MNVLGEGFNVLCRGEKRNKNQGVVLDRLLAQQVVDVVRLSERLK